MWNTDWIIYLQIIFLLLEVSVVLIYISWNILSWKGAQVLTFLVFIAAKYLSFAWLMAQEKRIHKFYNQAQKGFQPPSEL